MRLLDDYKEWASNMKDYEADPARRDFYSVLQPEIYRDCAEVDRESSAAFAGASNIALWEYMYLDQDGGTKAIQAWSTLQW